MKDETKEILTNADQVRSMLDSNGWKIVYDKLLQRVMDLQNIYNLDMSDVNTINVQLAARKMAVETIRDWIKADVHGFVEQQESNSQDLTEKAQTEFIGRE